MGSDINETTSKNFNNKELVITNTNINLIKSKIIIRKVFSYLTARKKCDFIKYNNKLKNIFGYNTEDYKKLCNRYIMVGKNGKGIEYFMNPKIILFEVYIEMEKEMEKGKNIILMVN